MIDGFLKDSRAYASCGAMRAGGYAVIDARMRRPSVRFSVSRPYLVARIDASDIPLHQQVGNQRRILKSAVLARYRRQQTRRRKALGQLGTHLDREISTC